VNISEFRNLLSTIKTSTANQKACMGMIPAVAATITKTVSWNPRSRK
jgi:hypothetical protein